MDKEQSSGSCGQLDTEQSESFTTWCNKYYDEKNYQLQWEFMLCDYGVLLGDITSPGTFLASLTVLYPGESSSPGQSGMVGHPTYDPKPDK